MNSGNISNDVKDFLKGFSTAIEENNLLEIIEYYSTGWNKITRENYQNTNWPNSMIVEANISIKGQSRELFLYLYRERYYNHLFSRFSVFDSRDDLHFCLKDHIESYQNFIGLFNFIIKMWREDKTNKLRDFELPNVWSWDLIQNFINQCQAYHIWKKLDLNDPHEKPNEKTFVESIWSLPVVFRYLYIFSWYAGIPINLGLEIESLPNSHIHMKQSLGQFSIIGILRLNTLLGDYSSALECLGKLNLKILNALTMSWTCEMTILYHETFCLMMKACFNDALKNFSKVRTKYEKFFNSKMAKKTSMNRFRLWFHRLRQMQILCRFLSFQNENGENNNSLQDQKEWIISLYDNSKPDFIGFSKKNASISAQRNTFSLLIEPLLYMQEIGRVLKMYRSLDLNRFRGHKRYGSFILKLLKHKLNVIKIQKNVQNRFQHELTYSHNLDFVVQENCLKTEEIKSIINYADEIYTLIRKVIILKQSTGR